LLEARDDVLRDRARDSHDAHENIVGEVCQALELLLYARVLEVEELRQ
jgi:hypothetical protein